MDAQERRVRITKMLEEDPDYRAMAPELESSKSRFSRLAAFFPKRMRNVLWSYPGLSHFVYNRVLDLISEEMRFPEEETERGKTPIRH